MIIISRSQNDHPHFEPVQFLHKLPFRPILPFHRCCEYGDSQRSYRHQTVLQDALDSTTLSRVQGARPAVAFHSADTQQSDSRSSSLPISSSPLTEPSEQPRLLSVHQNFHVMQQRDGVFVFARAEVFNNALELLLGFFEATNHSFDGLR